MPRDKTLLTETARVCETFMIGPPFRISARVVPSPASLTSLSDASQEPRKTWFGSAETWLVDYYEIKRLCGGFVNGKFSGG